MKLVCLTLIKPLRARLSGGSEANIPISWRSWTIASLVYGYIPVAVSLLTWTRPLVALPCLALLFIAAKAFSGKISTDKTREISKS